MSASREKKARQELNASGYVDPNVEMKAKEDKKLRRDNTILTIVVVAFVLVALFFAGKNVLQDRITGSKAAVTIDGENYTVTDVNYFFYGAYNNTVSAYSDYLDALGLDTSSDLRTQPCALDQEKSWYDYFLDQALESMKSVATLCHKAEAEGFTADDAVKATEKDAWDGLKSYAASNSLTAGDFLKRVYGAGMTKSAYLRCVRMIALADAYQSAYGESLSYTEDELQAEYEKEPNLYKHADIEMVYFPVDTSAEDAEAAFTAAKDSADKAKSLYQNGEKLEAVAEELGGQYYNMPYAFYDGYEISNWAFDSARRAGDVGVVTLGESEACALILFHSASRNDFHTVSVRHILVDTEEKAQELLDLWQGGVASEERFAELAVENSTDGGSAANGGLYEDVMPGQMVAPFEEWCFDESREVGDTGIVPTEYGFHVMYFSSAAELPYWQEYAKLSLQSVATNEWLSEQVKDVEVTRLDAIKNVW